MRDNNLKISNINQKFASFCSFLCLQFIRMANKKNVSSPPKKPARGIKKVPKKKPKKSIRGAPGDMPPSASSTHSSSNQANEIQSQSIGTEIIRKTLLKSIDAKLKNISIPDKINLNIIFLKIIGQHFAEKQE